MAVKTTKEEFIRRAKLVHDDKYDYSKVDYKGTKVPVEIICPEHGSFWQKPEKHTAGQNCPKCSGRFMDKNYLSRSWRIYPTTDEPFTRCRMSCLW